EGHVYLRLCPPVALMLMCSCGYAPKQCTLKTGKCRRGSCQFPSINRSQISLFTPLSCVPAPRLYLQN
uniref:Uncharacterized protein n=1 Tax=Crocodylus porosus TaxID=8502 RepID=A0A7M4F1R1_CROPO